MPEGKFPSTFVRKGRILKQHTEKGYYNVCLSVNGSHKRHAVHRLVASAFVPNKNGYPQVNHKDENPLNNNACNLEWCTLEYNNNYGTRKRNAGIANSGEKSHFHKMTEEDVVYARSVYIPYHPEYGATALAKKFGVNSSTMCTAISGKSWPYIGARQQRLYEIKEE